MAQQRSETSVGAEPCVYIRWRLTERHIALQPILSGSLHTRREIREPCCLLQSYFYGLTGQWVDE